MKLKEASHAKFWWKDGAYLPLFSPDGARIKREPGAPRRHPTEYSPAWEALRGKLQELLPDVSDWDQLLKGFFSSGGEDSLERLDRLADAGDVAGIRTQMSRLRGFEDRMSRGGYGKLNEGKPPKKETNTAKLSKARLQQIIREEIGAHPAELAYERLASGVGDLIRVALEEDGLSAGAIRDAIGEALDEELGAEDDTPLIGPAGS